jgi:hypothetical protein
MKKVYLFLIVLALGKISFSQFSATANLGIMYYMGESYSGYDYRLQPGINLSGKYTFKEKMRAGLNIGYYTRSIDGFRVSTRPVTVSFDYIISTSSKIKPYGSLELGTYGFIYSSDGESSSTSDIGLAPAFGFDYAINEKLDLNGNLKYNYVLTKEDGYGENTSILGFNVGVTYKF